MSRRWPDRPAAKALSGGFRCSPATPVGFSGNARSGANLQVSTREGLPPGRVPNALHRRAADAGRLGHRAATPGRGPRRRLVQRGLREGLDLLRGERRFPTADGAPAPPAGSPSARNRAPTPDRRTAATERGREARLGAAVAGQQPGFGTRRYGAVARCAHIVRVFRSPRLNGSGAAGMVPTPRDTTGNAIYQYVLGTYH